MKKTTLTRLENGDTQWTRIDGDGNIIDQWVVTKEEKEEAERLSRNP